MKITKLEILWTEASDLVLCEDIVNAIPSVALQIKCLDHAWHRVAKANQLGYEKTKVRVTLENGETYENRWDISPKEDMFEEWLEKWAGEVVTY